MVYRRDHPDDPKFDFGHLAAEPMANSLDWVAERMEG